MAVPIIAASSKGEVSTSGPSLTVAAPAGMSSGDLDLVVVLANHMTNNKVLLTPAGYTQHVQIAVNYGRFLIAVLWRAAEAAPSSLSLGVQDGANFSRAAALRYRVTGADLVAPLDASSPALVSGTAAPNTTPTMTLPGVTTTVADCLAIGALYWGSSYVGGTEGSLYGLTAGWTTAGLNNRVSVAGGAYNTNGSGVIASKAMAVAGATGDLIFSPGYNADATAKDWIAHMFAIAPGEGGGPEPGALLVSSNFLGL